MSVIFTISAWCYTGLEMGIDMGVDTIYFAPRLLFLMELSVPYDIMTLVLRFSRLEFNV
jgi:hypothetical protein